MKRHLLQLLLLSLLIALPVYAREKCVKAGCKAWGPCTEGVRLLSGEIVYGRVRDCCEPFGRGWYPEVEMCRKRPWWWWEMGLDFWQDHLAEPSLRTTGVDFGAHLPWFRAIDPVIHAGVGRTDASFDFDSGSILPARYRGSGTLWSFGADVTDKPCALCPWSLKADYRYRTLRNVDTDHFTIGGGPVPPGPATSTLHFSASEVGVGVQYSALADRLQTSLGVRYSDISTSIDTTTFDSDYGLFDDEIRTKADLDKTEIVGGIEYRWTPSWSGRIEVASDGDAHRTAASLRYRFGHERVTEFRPPTPIPPVLKDVITRPEQDCNSAIPVCRLTYEQTESYDGHGSLQEISPTGTCLQTGETNSVWYVFTVQNPGSLTFSIQTQNDYDFALYNITQNGCAGIAGTQPVRCNYSGRSGVTGLVLPSQGEAPISVDSAGPLTMPGVNVRAGDTYVLIVDNYSDDDNGYTLSFGGTATIVDSGAPTLQAASMTPTANEIEVTTSEPIQCSSIAPDGSDFTISAPEGVTVTSALGVACGAFTNRIRLKYTVQRPEECGTWLIRARTGSDGNSLTDNCGNAMSGSGAVKLAMAPTAKANLTLSADTFCEGAPIIADGAASVHEERHFWSVVESDANWNVIGKECMRWFEGPAGTLDVAAFAKAEGCTLQCGHFYRVKVAVQNCATTWDETVKLIRIQCPPVADAGPDKSVCCGCGTQKIKIGSAPVAGVQYSWSPTIGLDNPTSSGPTIDMSLFSDPSIPFPSVYEVTASDSLGCSSKDSVYVKSVCGCRPGATITVSQPTICSRSVTLTANCDCGDATPSYHWSNGATTKSIEVTNGGTYWVTCSNECGATVSKPVTVPALSPLEGGFPSIQCPNVFTPNGDGTNDFWTVKDLTKLDGVVPAYNATEYSLRVFNRWGNEIAILYGSTSTGFANNTIPGWNGVATENVSYNWLQHLLGRKDSHAGEAVSDGTYYYILQMRNCTMPWTDICNGFITVIR